MEDQVSFPVSGAKCHYPVDGCPTCHQPLRVARAASLSHGTEYFDVTVTNAFFANCVHWPGPSGAKGPRSF
jgi:hypothetical protein